MYVRFRERNSRLLVSLISSKRLDGKHHKEHVAYLGSVPIPAEAKDRIRFWQQLHQRLARLANRIGGEEAKLMAAIHARIPMYTPDELRAVKVLEAESDQHFWEGMRDMNLGTAEDYERTIAVTVRKSIESFRAEARDADTRATAARERAERIKRGEQ